MERNCVLAFFDESATIKGHVKKVMKIGLWHFAISQTLQLSKTKPFF